MHKSIETLLIKTNLGGKTNSKDGKEGKEGSENCIFAILEP
jgi:hypothetical protein